MKPCTIRYNTEQDALELVIPATTNESSHALFFHGEEGLKALSRVLRKRESATESRMLGTEAAPVQSQIDDWLRKNKVTTEADLTRAKDYSDVSDDDFADMLKGINI